MNDSTAANLIDTFLDLLAGNDDERRHTWYLAEAVDYADLERRLAQVGRRTRTSLFS
jgi:hypothetical protein